MKKNIVLTLCLVLILSCILGSCGDKSTDGNEEDSILENESENITEETEDPNDRESVKDNLPDMDFGGYNFRIYTMSSTNNTFENCVVCEDPIGEVINDTIYAANTLVEERFNISINTIIAASDDNGMNSAIKKSISAGDDSFDLAFANDHQMGTASLEGLFVNLYDVPYLDFSMPWWPKHTVESLTFNNQMYVFSNSISTLGMDWTRIIYVNKGLAKDMGISMPYQDVFDGAWTLEKLILLSKDAYIDVNGDGNKDKNDIYGFGYGGPFYCSPEPLAIQTVKKGEDTLELSINNERTLKAVDLMYELVFNPNSYYDKDSYEGTSIDMFGQGSCLFIQGELGKAREKFRHTNIDYGILPFPKLDDKQENYYAGYTDRLFVVPTTTTNLERTGVIIEAMSAEGWKKVFPAYYEIAMKNKYLSDEESITILDMIYSSRVLDFSYIYSIKYYMFLTDLFGGNNPSTDFISYYDKNITSVEKTLIKIEEKFVELGNK